MKVHLGQQQADGTIRYVSVYNAQNRLIAMLRNFYPTESRVTALIDLGNLFTVNPTPYGKFTGYYDEIHCRAEIRDDNQKKGKHLPRYGSDAEFLKLEGHLFLHKDGKWHYHYPDGLSTSLPLTLPAISTTPLDGLEFYYLDEKGEISYLYGKDYKSWDNIAAQSESKKSPIFVFRNNKLIRTINHPLNQQ